MPSFVQAGGREWRQVFIAGPGEVFIEKTTGQQITLAQLRALSALDRCVSSSERRRVESQTRKLLEGLL